jgi:hypothetical protein
VSLIGLNLKKNIGNENFCDISCAFAPFYWSFWPIGQENEKKQIFQSYRE